MENLIQYWPQITVISIVGITIATEIYANEKEKYYKFPNIFQLILLIVNPLALGFGGFFHITLPFFIWLFLFSVGVGAIFSRIGQVRKNVSLLTLLITVSLVQGLYYWGGFYDIFLK